MKTLTTFSCAALMAMGAILPASTTPADARHGRGKVAAGIFLGAAALAIIANSSGASASERRWARRCNRWYDQCMDGNDYACEKFETRGCSE